MASTPRVLKLQADDESTLPSAGLDDPDPGQLAARPAHRLGRYVVLEHLGSGGMAVVYAAYDPELDRKVAIKVLRARRRERKGSAELLREAQAMAKLRHPNVVAIHDVGSLDGKIYLAMEYVSGATLRQWTSARPRTWREVVQVFAEAGRGLAAAHAQDVIHRDFKPDNVMVDDTGHARVMDFGLAVAEASESTTSAPGEPRWSERVVGTPSYMAPEQFRMRKATTRSDQFSFCVALWEALYRSRPYLGQTRAALAASFEAGRQAPPADAPSVPAWVRRVVERGLRVDPRERWPSMDAIVAALQPDRGRARLVWGGLAAAVVAGGAFTLLAESEPQLCTGGAAAMDQAWSVERRASIEAAMHAAPRSFGRSVWQRVGARMDEWSALWISTHDDRCAATRIRGEQSEKVLDRAMGCLYRARDAFDAAADVLADAD